VLSLIGDVAGVLVLAALDHQRTFLIMINYVPTLTSAAACWTIRRVSEPN